jgi:hypothetical protein
MEGLLKLLGEVLRIADELGVGVLLDVEIILLLLVL